MKNSPLKKALHYVSKMFSTALLIVLIIVGLFLVYYLISAKMVAKNPQYEPKINLYTIVSGSMEPNIRVYDVIVDYKVNNPEELKIGDVITFRSTSTISKDLIVTHRIIDTKVVNGKVEYVTKGDWNSSADSDTAKFDHIIGKVVLRFPQLGRVQFFLATRMGWFLVVLLPAMCVIIYDVIKLIKLLALKKNGDSIKPTNNAENIKVNIEKVEFKEEKIKEERFKEEEFIEEEIKEEKIPEKEIPFEEKINKEFNQLEYQSKNNKNNNNKKKNNNNSNNKNNKKNNNSKNSQNNSKIINDTLENIKKSDYKKRLNSLRDYENK